MGDQDLTAEAVGVESRSSEFRGGLELVHTCLLHLSLFALIEFSRSIVYGCFINILCGIRDLLPMAEQWHIESRKNHLSLIISLCLPRNLLEQFHKSSKDFEVSALSTHLDYQLKSRKVI